jgi:hypothetical protein
MSNPCYCKKPKPNADGYCKNCYGLVVPKGKKETKKEENLLTQIEKLQEENAALKKRLRAVEIEGWKSKDQLEIDKIGAEWVLTEHRKDKLSGEIATNVHRIPEQNVGMMWQLIQDLCKVVGKGITYRKLVPSLMEKYHFPIELEEFNGGRNRARYYFPFYYYPLKILEHLKWIRYGGRGKIVRLQ